MTTILPDQTTINCPPWCTSGPHKPEDLHSTTLPAAGGFTVRIDQYINLDGTSTGEPVQARVDGIEGEELDAQGCRDLAAAMLQTARFIDAATL